MKEAAYSVYPSRDRRYPRKGTIDLCPVQLNVNIKGVQQFKLGGLGLYATEEDYTKALLGKGGTEAQKELRKEINKYVSKAEAVLEKLPHPTKALVQRMFRSEAEIIKGHNRCSVEFHFDLHIENLKKNEQFGTALVYTNTLRSFQGYKPKLDFEDVTPDFLAAYERWMLSLSNSIATVQIYMRTMRAMFNRVMAEGYVAERFYPFKKYVIGTTQKSKEVLYPEQIRLLLSAPTETLRERRAKDYFLFSYLGSGMNFKDVAYLKWKNVQKDTISFVREKTKRTNRVADKEIRVYLHDEMRRVIKEWGVASNDPEAYVFPIVQGRDTAEARERKRDNLQRQVNDNLKVLAARVGLESNVILKIARHSFSTKLKLDGTPIAFIQDALGHSSSKTTEHYLKGIPDQHLKAMSQSLLDF